MPLVLHTLTDTIDFLVCVLRCTLCYILTVHAYVPISSGSIWLLVLNI